MYMYAFFSKRIQISTDTNTQTNAHSLTLCIQRKLFNHDIEDEARAPKRVPSEVIMFSV